MFLWCRNILLVLLRALLATWSSLLVILSPFRTKRVLYPNVQRKTYYSPILKVKLQIRVTTHTMRCIDKAGGFDHYVFHTPPKRHSKLGNYLRQKIVDTIREKGLQPPSKVGRPHKPPKGRGEMGKTSHTRTDSATVLQEWHQFTHHYTNQFCVHVLLSDY